MSPCWSVESPPYNLALLKAVLHQAGYAAVCYDLNIVLYNHIEDKAEKENWSGIAKIECWREEGFVAGIFKKYSIFIDNFVNELLNLDTKLIGFSVNYANALFTTELIKKIKKINRDKIIILGGPLRLPGDKGVGILRSCAADAICTGEGETAFINFLGIIKNKGSLEKCTGIMFKNKEGNDVIDGGDSPPLENLDKIPFADFSVFKLSDYKQRMLPISIGRGCVNRCIFCSEWQIYGRYRSRSAPNVFEEMIYQKERYPHLESFWFCDSLINGNIKVLDELCTLLIENKVAIKWGGQAVVRKEMTLDFLKKLKQAGCSWLIYGVESGSNTVLRLMRKSFTVELSNKVIRETKEAGLSQNINIIVGFPKEGEKEFNETVDFVKGNLQFVDSVNLSPLSLSNELICDKDRWQILFPENEEKKWFTKDGKNTKEIRCQRLNILGQIVSDKLVI